MLALHDRLPSCWFAFLLGFGPSIFGRRLPTTPDVRVKQYNILASYLGNNDASWFLYGAGLSDEQRADIKENYFVRRHVNRKLQYVNNIGNFYNYTLKNPRITEEQRRLIKEYDDRYFKWQARKERVLQEILRGSPHIIALSELDNINGRKGNDEFLINGLYEAGYTGTWALRPNRNRPGRFLRDGCAVFWLQERFALLSNSSVEDVPRLEDAKEEGHAIRSVNLPNPPTRLFLRLADRDLRTVMNRRASAKKRRKASRNLASSNLVKPDRVALMVALKDLRTQRNLAVVTAHLNKNPALEYLDEKRNMQLRYIDWQFKDFAAANKLNLMPSGSGEPPDGVILAGDFNYERSAFLSRGYMPRLSTDNMMRSVFPGGVAGDDDCTTKTLARQMTIDYLLFSCSALEVRAALKDQCPAGRDGVIPNAVEPSDHMPIGASFRWRSSQTSCSKALPVSAFPGGSKTAATKQII